MRNRLTKTQQIYVDLRIGGKTPIEAYREAYDKPEIPPKQASNRSRELEKKPHIKALITGHEAAVEEAIVEKKAEAIVDHQEEVRDHLRRLIESSMADNKHSTALDAIRLLGQMDGCGNFLEHAPEQAANETNINIGMSGSPLDAIRQTLLDKPRATH